MFNPAPCRPCRPFLVRSLLISFLFVIIIQSIAVAAGKSRYFSETERHYLISILAGERFEPSFLHGVFYDQRLKKFPVAVAKNVHNKENQRDYNGFYSAYSFMIAKQFQKKWRTLLKNASETFNVDQEVLVAILLVETGLGNVLGRYPVISVFSSILVEYKQSHEQYSKRAYLSSEESYKIRRLTEKAQWARKELIALLTIVKETEINPLQLRGSFAGAFGIPQFLPSSYVKWGVDSDQNGSVNLFLVPDAVYSTANYLKAHGWKKGLYRESNKDVIYKYNKSEIYVDTVLNIARKIKASRKPDTKKSQEQTG